MIITHSLTHLNYDGFLISLDMMEAFCRQYHLDPLHMKVFISEELMDVDSGAITPEYALAHIKQKLDMETTDSFTKFVNYANMARKAPV